MSHADKQMRWNDSWLCRAGKGEIEQGRLVKDDAAWRAWERRGGGGERMLCEVC